MPLPDDFGVDLDPSSTRSRDGRVLLGGAPFRILRLSPDGARVVARLSQGATVGQAGPGAGILARRLVEGGLAVPRPPMREGRGTQPVTVVVPVRDRAPLLRRLLPVLCTDPAVGDVLVVDDGSRDDSATTAKSLGARVLQLAAPGRPAGGPAAARNAGLAEVAGPVAAVVDSDCLPDAGWLPVLTAHLQDPAVAVVAPRVRAAGVSDDLLDRYERRSSPLDLGDRAGPVRPGARLSYAPAAALLLRTDAVRALGGFDESLRYGEDVDLLWRLTGRGWSIRYEPVAVVRHRHRPGLAGLVRSRVAYNSAAAPLARRHAGALAPARVPLATAATWTAAALAPSAALPSVAGGAGLALVADVWRLRRLAPALPTRQAVGLVARGRLAGAAGLAQAVRRAWWPILVVLGVRHPTGARRALAWSVLPLLRPQPWKRPGDAAAFPLLRLVDDLAASMGTWAGVLRWREPGPLLPSIVRWPRSRGR